MFAKVAVANRGEIAVRVMRACEELGIATIALYVDADRDAPHVHRADHSFSLGIDPAAYLDIALVIDATRRAEADAIHPGYGFLAENAEFAARVEAAGLTFIGPPPAAIEAMGSKTRARQLMSAAGVPIVPGSTAPAETADAALAEALEIGFPVAVKAVSGGGGKAFRVAADEAALDEAFAGASREGERFFGDGTVYLERYLHRPRHVEVQVLADRHRNCVHLGERDCSIQRRHQKLIEEAPAPDSVVDAPMRERIGKIGVAAAAAVGYVGAGTVEGILSGDDYFFLEMNTRVQVEHCVTEMVTGIDIVREGIRVAAGEPLAITQADVELRGHAIECRINAEDASRGFIPTPGRITAYEEPGGPGVRVDSGVRGGDTISPSFDSLVAKLIVWDSDREAATERMLRALGEFRIEGLTTLVGFHRALLDSADWRAASDCADLLGDPAWLACLEVGEPAPVAIAAPAPVAIGPFGPRLADAPGTPRRPGSASRSKRRDAAAAGTGAVLSPLGGNVWKMLVAEGQELAAGETICIVEAMKMENEIVAPRAGTVLRLAVAEGEPIAPGALVAELGDPA